MDIIKKFTSQNLKKNKKRTIVTVIGIMLSTALICAVAGMIITFKNTVISTIKKSQGDYHVCYNNVPKEQLKYIENNVNVEEYFYTSNIGYAYLEGSQNVYKPYIFLTAFDKKALEKNAIKLVNGRMPENEKEILISEHMMSNGRVYWNIGDTVTLEIGTRQLKTGEKLTQNNPYGTEYDDIDNKIDRLIDYKKESNEEIVNTIKNKYTIVGIIERPNYSIEEYSAPGYTIITYMEDDKIREAEANIAVRLKKPQQFEEISKKIIETIKNNTGIIIDSNTNITLLRFEGALRESSLKAILYLGIIIIGIIVVSSVFVIRNSFNISVSEKTKQYGMMASVGATSKQIRKSVLLEGFVIGLIAIPLGIILGIIAIFVLIQILNILLSDTLGGIKFIYGIPMSVILITILMSGITIYLSCIIPARRAGKISPIDAIRGNNDIKIKSRKLHTSKLTKKIFGIGGVIARKNLKRSKKKYRTTVISIVVSIAVFIPLSSFLQYGQKFSRGYNVDYKYNITVDVTTNATDNQEESLNIYNEIIKKCGINDYSYSYQTQAFINSDSMTEYGKELAKAQAENSNYDISNNETIDELTLKVIKLNKEYFEKYARSQGITKNFKNASILDDEIISIVQTGEGKEEYRKVVRHLYNVKEGEELNYKDIDNNESYITITKISNEGPMGYEGSSPIGGFLFISEENDMLKDSITYLGPLCINSEKPNETEEKINNLKTQSSLYSDIEVFNINKYTEQNKRLVLVISIFLYGFITVITLIGVTNIFNTITTNMILRSKEFAMLKSVGMTSKEFNRMIRLESIMYGAKSLIIGIPIGILLSYAIYKALAIDTDFGYVLPMNAIIISIIFVFIIVGLTMRYSLKKINKQNIVDTIRNDNI